MSKPVSISFYCRSSLNSIPSNKNSDLIISNDDEEMRVNSFVASQFSSAVFRRCLEDTCSLKMSFNIPKGVFMAVCSYLNGNDIEITQDNCVGVYESAISLCSRPLHDKAVSFIINTQTKQVVLKCILSSFNANMPIDELVYHISSKFSDFLSIGIISALPDDILDLIFQSYALDCNKDKINEIVLSRINKNPNNRLIKHLNFKSLDSEVSKMVLSHPKFNTNILRYTILRSLDLKNENKVKSRGSSNTIFEIISQIQKPTITASSCAGPSYDPSKILDESDSYYCSEKGPSDWIMLDFSPLLIELHSYSLKSWKIGSNGVVPSSWKVEIKTDNEWETVHVVQNSKLLQGNRAMSKFDLENPSKLFSIMRITQISNLNPGNQKFALSSIQVFGKVQ